MKDGITINNNYKLDLDTLGECARIGMVRTHEGKLHFFLDGIDQGVACENVPRGW